MGRQQSQRPGCRKTASHLRREKSPSSQVLDPILPITMSVSQTMKMKKPRLPAPSRFRRLWGLASGTVFLNHGSFGACPKAVLGVQTRLRRQMEAELVQFLWRRYDDLVDAARIAVAKFV